MTDEKRKEMRDFIRERHTSELQKEVLLHYDELAKDIPAAQENIIPKIYQQACYKTILNHRDHTDPFSACRVEWAHVLNAFSTYDENGFPSAPADPVKYAEDHFKENATSEEGCKSDIADVEIELFFDKIKAMDPFDVGVILSALIEEPGFYVEAFNRHMLYEQYGNYENYEAYHEYEDMVLLEYINELQNNAAHIQGADSLPSKEMLEHIEETAEVTKKLQKNLKKEIFGQDQAVDKFVSACFESNLIRTLNFSGENDAKLGLKGTFLFAGSPGTGKTMLAETVSEYMGLACKVFNMTAYSSHEDGKFNLFGTDPIWKSTHAGALSKWVWENPESIIVMDEIEKAHVDVHMELLNILSRGYYEDPIGPEATNPKTTLVDMSGTILIFTTNAGKNLYDNEDYGEEDEIPASVIIDALKKDKNANTGKPVFPPELVSRFAAGNVIFFKPLTPEILLEIVRKGLKTSEEKLKKGFKIENDPKDLRIAATILYGSGGKLDGRTTLSRAESFYTGNLYQAAGAIGKWAKAARKEEAELPDTADAQATEDRKMTLTVDMDFSNADKKVEELYKHKSSKKIAECMKKLTSRHLVLKYQVSVAEDTAANTVTITLKDFKLEKSIEAEDMDSVLSTKGVPDKTWDDVIVTDDVRHEFKFFIEFLKDADNKKKYKGFLTPKGILLYGPPGTGKTSLAQVIANQANLSFYQVSAANMVNGTITVKDCFAKCRKYAPSILFIDEIDAIDQNNHKPIYNALLAELDGFAKHAGRPVFVIAATNHKETMGDALLRRFDRKILIDVHNSENRLKQINRIIEKDEQFDLSKPDVKQLVSRMAGMSPAEIESALQTAKRCAFTKKRKVDLSIAMEGLELSLYGEKNNDNSKLDPAYLEEEKKKTAYHEAGHIIAYWLFQNCYPSYATIVSRQDLGGYMSHDAESEKRSTRQDLLNSVRTTLGGRAAEIILYGENEGISVGPTSDLRSATRKIINMIFYHGMYPEYQLITLPYGSLSDETILKDPVYRDQVNKALMHEMEATITEIKVHAKELKEVAEALLEKEQLLGSEVEKILSKYKRN